MLAGCGDGGSLETSGTLTMSKLEEENGVVTATATFSTASPNIPINFEYYFVGETSLTRTPASGHASKEGNTDNTGTTTFNYLFNPGRLETVVFYVNAKYGGLSTGWKSVVVAP